MPRFAANLTMMFQEVPFADRFAAAAAAGFSAVECLFPYTIEAERLGTLLRDNNLTLALFNLPPGNWNDGERGLAIYPGRRQELLDGMSIALRYAAASGAGRLHMMAGLGRRDDAVAVDAYRDAVATCARTLGPHGLDLMLEPINNRSMPGYFLDDFDWTAALIGDLGLPNVKLQFDVFHRQIMHGDVIMALRRWTGIIGHVQIAGVPDRGEPDRGELDVREICEELDRLGYQGFVGCEYHPRGDTVAGLGWLDDWRGSVRADADNQGAVR